MLRQVAIDGLGDGDGLDQAWEAFAKGLGRGKASERIRSVRLSQQSANPGEADLSMLYHIPQVDEIEVDVDWGAVVTDSRRFEGLRPTSLLLTLDQSNLQFLPRLLMPRFAAELKHLELGTTMARLLDPRTIFFAPSLYTLRAMTTSIYDIVTIASCFTDAPLAHLDLTISNWSPARDQLLEMDA